MLYKRKQVYWIDIIHKDKRIKEFTGSKSKKKAEEYAIRVMRDLMIQNRLDFKDSSMFKDRAAVIIRVALIWVTTIKTLVPL